MSDGTYVTNVCHYCDAVGPQPHDPNCAYWLTLKDMEGGRVSNSDDPRTGAALAALAIENARHAQVTKQVMGEHMTEYQGNLPITSTEEQIDAFVKRVCERAPLPLDDVGGCSAADFYPEELEELDFAPTDESFGLTVRLPSDSATRKDLPIATGCLDYFPLALAEVARVSKISGDKHHPGQPTHWERGKSVDHADCLVRHLLERGKLDVDGMRHSAKVAWRALALLQIELEETGL